MLLGMTASDDLSIYQFVNIHKSSYNILPLHRSKNEVKSDVWLLNIQRNRPIPDEYSLLYYKQLIML